jgi:DNA repair protein RadA/Sms
MVEEVVAVTPPPAVAHAARGLGASSTPRRLSEITGDAEERLQVSIGEFARVLGGGVVPGSSC